MFDTMKKCLVSSVKNAFFSLVFSYDEKNTQKIKERKVEKLSSGK